MWANNVRATTRGQVANCVLMDNRLVVRVISAGERRPAGNFDLLAVVSDYGDHTKIRFYPPNGYSAGQGQALKAPMHKLGRRGLNVV